MIRRRHVDQDRVEVHFTAPGAYQLVAVVGDFNSWDPHAAPMRPNGTHTEIRLVLPAGRRYRFRYLTATGAWCNDETADEYTPNIHGGYDCVLDLVTDS